VRGVPTIVRIRLAHIAAISAMFIHVSAGRNRAVDLRKLSLPRHRMRRRRIAGSGECVVLNLRATMFRRDVFFSHG
jgi:hypothetical protein